MAKFKVGDKVVPHQGWYTIADATVAVAQPDCCGRIVLNATSKSGKKNEYMTWPEYDLELVEPSLEDLVANWTKHYLSPLFGNQYTDAKLRLLEAGKKILDEKKI